MPVSNPVPDLLRFVYQTLQGDAETAALIPAPGEPGDVRVYEGQVPQADDGAGLAALYPCILVTVVTAGHVRGNGGRRFATRPLLQIEAVGETESTLDLEALAGRIDVLFGQRRGHDRVGQIIVAGCDCERAIVPPPDSPEGVQYRRLGGEYRLFIYAAP